MQYALVDGKRREAFPKAKALCPDCGSPMVAKCGSRVLHHWAHFRQRNCDPWWENETAWHRGWKNRFPEEWREISHVAPDGEIHRADLKIPTGIVVEFQHSAMSDAERISREDFYQNMVSMIDGTPFRENFEICHMLPHPESEIAEDLVWFKAKRNWAVAEGMFWRPSRNPGNTKTSARGSVEIQGISEILEQVKEAYRGHHQFDWVRPRRTWLDAKCPVFIDFGDNHLAQLMRYDSYRLPCIRYITLRKFIHDLHVETRAVDIGTRFYPL